MSSGAPVGHYRLRILRKENHSLGLGYRDAIMCPEHAKALDGLLKDIGQALRGEPAGSA